MQQDKIMGNVAVVIFYNVSLNKLHFTYFVIHTFINNKHVIATITDNM